MSRRALSGRMVLTLIKGKRATIALAVAPLIGPASPQVASPKHGVLVFTKSPQAFEPNGGCVKGKQ